MTSSKSSMSAIPGKRTALTAEPPREYLVSVELYVPNAAGSALRKPPVPRRKGENKKSTTPPISGRPWDENQKKVKEKPSWMSLARSSTRAGSWRPATCKLSDEDNRCLCNIYVDETILYQTVYVHALNHTDIRQADSSLFLRKNCLGIYSAGGQRWGSPHATDPLYLHFSDTNACNTWLALLRSYAKPELYGRQPNPDGGLYRMWRQVELTIIQGRNLGSPRQLSESISNTTANPDSDTRQEGDPVDMDVFCEINLNNTLCGRSTLKKCIGSPDWHEGFTLTDLPPFDTLEVIVWNEKRLLKPINLGSIRISLGNFRRGEVVEGWFPVIHAGPTAGGIQVGDIRMKMRVDEDIILPYSAYSGLLQVLYSRNILDWMDDFEHKLHLRSISSELMYVAIAKNVLLDQVFELADREVDGTPRSHNTLFRGNTILTKTIELCMAFYGKAFLEASIGSSIRRLCSEKIAIEVDPARSGKSTKDTERDVELLIYWCKEFWNQIYAVRNECPNEMRKLFEHVRKLVEKRYSRNNMPEEQSWDLPWQSVSAFCFLRFIVPAILHPHLFGLYPGLPTMPVQRSLTLIAKVIQSLANLNASVQKEDFMRGVKAFLKESVPAMVKYIQAVSTPVVGDTHGLQSGPAHTHARLNVVNSLHQRGATMPALEREAIPLLPHVLDIPRHLAVISSAVIRSVRFADHKQKMFDDPHLKELRLKCFELEEQALSRVNQLASRMPSVQRDVLTSSDDSPREPDSTPLPSSPRTCLQLEVARPSTASCNSTPSGMTQPM